MGQRQDLVASARKKAAEFAAPYILLIRRRGFFGWVAVVLAVIWSLTDQLSRVEFLLGKLAASKPMLSAAWAWIKSVPPWAYQTGLFVVGLGWLWWTRRHPPAAPINVDSVKIEVGPTSPAPVAEPSTAVRAGARAGSHRVSLPILISRPVFMFDLCWEISPKMWDPTYRMIQAPELAILDEVILGPSCPACSRALTVYDRQATGFGSGPRYRIENPCGRCNRNAKEFPVTFPDMQVEVYREVDRLIRRGEDLPKGPCAAPHESHSGSEKEN